MQVGNDGCHREFPLEAHCQIKHDAGHHKGQSLQAIGCQFFTDLRAHKFCAAQSGFGVLRFQSGHQGVALLRRTHALLRWQANHHIACGAKVLHLHIGVAQTRNDTAHLLQVGGLAVAHFHHGTAGELHRQMQTAAEQKEHGQQESHERDHVEDQRVLHEGNVFADFEKFHDAAPLYALSSVVAGTAAPSGRQTVPIDTDLSFF